MSPPARLRQRDQLAMPAQAVRKGWARPAAKAIVGHPLWHANQRQSFNSGPYDCKHAMSQADQDLLQRVGGALVQAISFGLIRPYRTPLPLEQSTFLERSMTEAQSGLTVTVAVPSREEAEAIFGTSLYASRIQPVWVDVNNQTDAVYVLMRAGMDPDYYSAREAAYARHTMSQRQNEKMDHHFESLAFTGLTLPRVRHTGFVFTKISEGHKSVYIDLLGDRDMHSFSFVVPVPGLVTDVEQVDFEKLYEKVDEIDDEAMLREALSKLPACTTNKNGQREGDPLNVVMIGTPGNIFSALIRREWHQTEVTYARSAWKTVKSFLFGSQYLYSPISPLYVFGRAQDIGMQKARGSVHTRNHMRLWRAPDNFRGRPVYVGQISRDIGVRWTTRSPTLTTHAIDPDVDDTRDGLVGDLAYSQAVPRIGYVGGVPACGRERPRENLTGDRYFTDGKRAVLFFEERPTSLVDLEILDWEFPDEAARVLR
jgi:hypothetical protein